jgi:hypothetical protein
MTLPNYRLTFARAIPLEIDSAFMTWTLLLGNVSQRVAVLYSRLLYRHSYLTRETNLLTI